MSIELKQAAQQVLDAFEAFGEADDFATLFTLTQKMNALRAAIQQAESEPVGEPSARVELMKTGGNAGLSTRIIELDIATRERLRPGDLLYTHPAPGVPEFSRIAKRKLDELQEQGFAITGYAIQRAAVRGFIDGGGFVGWWQGEPAPGVPDDVVRDAITTVREQYRGTEWGKASECICDAIDAAIDAAQAQKGQP
jgi:hypothetical protein